MCKKMNDCGSCAFKGRPTLVTAISDRGGIPYRWESDVETKAPDDVMEEGEGESDVEVEAPEAVVGEREGVQPLPTPARPGFYRGKMREGRFKFIFPMVPKNESTSSDSSRMISDIEHCKCQERGNNILLPRMKECCKTKPVAQQIVGFFI